MKISITPNEFGSIPARLALCVIGLSLVVAVPSAAQTDLSAVLDELHWGASSEQVISVERERLLDAYRASIAGINDPLRIDRERRSAEDRINEFRDSLEIFDTARTGYEVSVLGGEIVGGQGQSLLMTRRDVTTMYYIFTHDALTKVVVVYELSALNYIGFEGFVERLQQLFGRAEASDFEEDDIGRRMLRRASWSDPQTRLRVEDRSRMFASYVLVYSDAARSDITVDVGSVSRSTRPSGERNLGDVVRRLESDPNATATSNRNVVDSIIGSRVEVEINVGSGRDARTVAVGGTGGSSALDDDDDLGPDVPQLARPTSSGRTRGSSTTSDSDSDDGVTIY